MELDISSLGHLCSSGLIMHVNKVYRVSTIKRVAEDLGESEDWLFDVANEMDAEDGVIWVHGGRLTSDGGVIVSHCQQENRSRTVWITFHCRGMTSSVSATSSPSFDSLAEPKHGQLTSTAITTHSRGRSAESGFRFGRFRSKDLTIVERARETVGPPRPRRFEAEGRTY